jgi:hypothetical protein
MGSHTAFVLDIAESGNDTANFTGIPASVTVPNGGSAVTVPVTFEAGLSAG